jgi:hypothetical protein
MSPIFDEEPTLPGFSPEPGIQPTGTGQTRPAVIRSNAITRHRDIRFDESRCPR